MGTLHTERGGERTRRRRRRREQMGDQTTQTNQWGGRGQRGSGAERSNGREEMRGDGATGGGAAGGRNGWRHRRAAAKQMHNAGRWDRNSAAHAIQYTNGSDGSKKQTAARRGGRRQMSASGAEQRSDGRRGRHGDSGGAQRWGAQRCDRTEQINASPTRDTRDTTRRGRHTRRDPTPQDTQALCEARRGASEERRATSEQMQI